MSNWHLCSCHTIIICATLGAQILKNEAKRKLTKARVVVVFFLFLKINKINKPIAVFTKKKEDATKIRREKGNITTDVTEIKNDYERTL